MGPSHRMLPQLERPVTPTCIAGTYVDSPTLPPGVTNARLAGPGTITFSGDTVRFQGTR